jgi:hypothetical protein
MKCDKVRLASYSFSWLEMMSQFVFGSGTGAQRSVAVKPRA